MLVSFAASQVGMRALRAVPSGLVPTEFSHSDLSLPHQGFIPSSRSSICRGKRQRLEAVAEGQLVRWLDLPPDKVLATEDENEGL